MCCARGGSSPSGYWGFGPRSPAELHLLPPQGDGRTLSPQRCTESVPAPPSSAGVKPVPSSPRTGRYFLHSGLCRNTLYYNQWKTLTFS
ncbi:hypothetical protein NDU88_000854 [Pleurodeles waltl]|uniref:Uncharacterized protein n=1 Tax=Pleurodeles waltl TaxID=8319 RepID=A0AAV7NDF9_PLEWA|nr:hypothetical protein NDU88_000854 [Pleurodeles waltl]